jgi:biopolymer transport protein TolR
MGMDVGGASGGVKADINVTPLVDVCLVLLIIFMVITPMLQKGVPVQLPKTRNPVAEPEADKKDAVIITLEGGRMYFGKNAVPFEVIKSNLSETFAKHPNTKIYLKGDRRITFGDAKKILSAIQNVGFKKVALLTEHVDASGKPISGNAASAVAAEEK